MITLTVAKKKCQSIGCGFCLTHNPPLFVCNPMLNFLINENGLDWCKNYIQEWTINNYVKLTDDEIKNVFNKCINKSKNDSLYDFTLLDLINELES